MRKPAAPVSATATAIAAAPAVVIAERLEPAKPTRTMPVLVTGPFPADAALAVADIACRVPDAVAPMPAPVLALAAIPPPPCIDEVECAGAGV